MVRCALLILLLLIVSLQSTHAQEREYDIRLAGFHIGKMTVEKYLEDTLTYYRLSSKVKFWLFVRVSVDYSVTTAYHNELLISSVVKTKSSKGNFSSTTAWSGDHYIIHVDAYQYNKDTVIYDPIYFNIGKLYFEKPAKGQAIYADNYGLITQAKINKNGAIVVSVMDNPNTYFYEKDLLVKAEMYNPIKDFQIKLKSAK